LSLRDNIRLGDRSEVMSGDVDVLIITALQDELEALKKVTAGALGEGWREVRDRSRYSYYLREFEQRGGGAILVAVARAVKAGPVNSAMLATRLVGELRPRCLAMSGICAGWRKETFLGDVVVAERVFHYDAGKLKAYRSVDNQSLDEVLYDIETYNLNPHWYSVIPEFSRQWLNDFDYPRPLSYGCQERWLLNTLYEHEQDSSRPYPADHPERRQRCPDWGTVVEKARLSKRIHLTRKLTLLRGGRAYIETVRALNPDAMPDDPPLRVHLGALGTGTKVIVDSEVFETLSRVNRKIIGLEMEAAAIGEVAAQEEVQHMIVVKAVQDFADHDKDDSLRHFAAQASASFLLAFLRAHLPPRGEHQPDWTPYGEEAAP
jgi:nucleoside phosphorylase